MGVGLVGPTAAHADVHFNGFGQVVMGTTLNNNRPMPANTTLGEYAADPNFRPESLFALQAQATLSDSISATAQILADGATNGNPSPGQFTNDDFTPKFSWAYMTWSVNDYLSVKAGRQRLPLYHYSDYLQVGEAYTWIRPPISVYSAPVSNYDGLSLNGNFSFGDWFLQPQVYYGNFGGSIYYRQLNADLALDNLMGIVLDASYSDWLELRASAHTSKATATYEEVSQLQSGLSQIRTSNSGLADALEQYDEGVLAIPGLFQDITQTPFYSATQDLTTANTQYQSYLNSTTHNKETLSFYSAGMSVNKWGFLLDGEYVFQHSPNYLPDTIAYYVSLAYKYKDLTPYITFGHDRKRVGDKAEGNRMVNDIDKANNSMASAMQHYAGNPTNPSYINNGCAGAGEVTTLTSGAVPAVCTATSPSDISNTPTPALLAEEYYGPDGVSGAVPQLFGAGNYLVNSSNTVDDYYELGLRYDVSRSTALKLDYTYYSSPQAQSAYTGPDPNQGYQHGQLLSAAFVFTF